MVKEIQKLKMINSCPSLPLRLRLRLRLEEIDLDNVMIGGSFGGKDGVGSLYELVI